MSPKPNEDDTASETLMQTQSYYNAADGLAANEAATEPSFYERMQEVQVAKVWAPICNKYKWAVLGIWFVFWPLGRLLNVWHGFWMNLNRELSNSNMFVLSF